MRSNVDKSKFKVVYSKPCFVYFSKLTPKTFLILKLFYKKVAPLKALCSEKFNEWSKKFEYLNIKCIELTGDTDHESENDLSFIENSNIICTTPVK